MTDTLITAAAALIGALGGVGLARFWSRSDSIRARRKDWAVEVTKFLDELESDTKFENTHFSDAPQPSYDLEIADPTVIRVSSWVSMRSYQFEYQATKSRQDGEPNEKPGRRTIPASQYHRETRDVFASWARYSWRTRFRRFERENRRTPTYEYGFL